MELTKKQKYTIINPTTKEKLIKELETIGIKMRDNGRAIIDTNSGVELFSDRLQYEYQKFGGGFFMAYNQCYIKTNRKDAVWLTAIGRKSVFVGFYTHPKSRPEAGPAMNNKNDQAKT